MREYVQAHFVSDGMCADIAIHDKKNGNPHAHIMLTMRPLEQSGEWGAKSKKEYILDKNYQLLAGHQHFQPVRIAGNANENEKAVLEYQQRDKADGKATP